MNCQTIQNKILILPDPRSISEVLREHVQGCGECRVWVQQVARLESLLKRLPVPDAPDNKKATVVDELFRTGIPFATPAQSSAFGSLMRFLDSNKLVFGGLAAAVLVVLGGWWMLSGSHSPHAAIVEVPKDPFLDKIVKRDVAIARAETPVLRLQLLGGLAEDISTEARSLGRVSNGDGLRDLAQWFDKVVKDGLLRQAEKLPVDTLDLRVAAERKALMEALSVKLADVASQADKMKGEVPQDAKGAFQKIEDSARLGADKLQKMSKAG